MVATVALCAALLALGPVLVWRGQVTSLPGPYRLFDWIPGFYGLRAPVRWLGVSFTALGLFSGLGAWWLGRLTARWGRLPAVLIGLVLVGMLVAERATPRTGKPQQLQLDPVYRELDDIEGPGPIWDNALSKAPQGRSCHCGTARAYRAALYHGRPLVGGTAARGTEACRALQRLLMTWPSASAVELMRAVGTRVVLDHNASPLADIPGQSCTRTQGHTICVLEPRAALPEPGAVLVQGDGPVVGLRWNSMPTGLLEVRCGEQRLESSSEVWRVVTEMREGADAEHLDLFLELPCTESLDASPSGWAPLHADEGAPAWPPPWTGTGEGMEQAYLDLAIPTPPENPRGNRGPRQPRGKPAKRGGRPR